MNASDAPPAQDGNCFNLRSPQRTVATVSAGVVIGIAAAYSVMKMPSLSAGGGLVQTSPDGKHRLNVTANSGYTTIELTGPHPLTIRYPHSADDDLHLRRSENTITWSSDSRHVEAHYLDKVHGENSRMVFKHDIGGALHLQPVQGSHSSRIGL